MKVLNLRAQAVSVYHGEVLASVKNGSSITLVRITWPKLNIENLHTFSGRRSLLLSKVHDIYLVSEDEKLLVSRDLVEWKSVLKLKPNNIVWHACETPEGIIVQEYGESPTGLYMSNNGLEWTCIITNRDVDPKSKHFHYVAYDDHRDLLYVTLGDGNMVRAAAIRKDKRDSLYRGPWQFVPVVVMKEEIVFGFDSGIARGGVGLYRPEDVRWSFIFLKYTGSKFAQMSELIQANGLWLTALGTPQALLVSKDLKLWYPIHIEGYARDFNHNMTVRSDQGLVVGSTGSSLVLAKIEDIVIGSGQVMEPYTGLLDRVKGKIFNLKRITEF